MIGPGDHVLLADGLVHVVTANWLRRPQDEVVFCFDVLCQEESVVAYKLDFEATKEVVTCLICVGR